MIYESYPWKQDLLLRKRLIIKYNRAEILSEENDDRAYTVIEKAVFYSAFIIRKLIDCKGKVSDEVDNYRFTVKRILPQKKVDLIHRWLDEESHDWEQETTCTKSGTEICNWLIHSFIFFFCYDETDIIESFYVSSDYDKNKWLYRVKLKDWIDYMEFVGRDSVVSTCLEIDKENYEYVYTLKKRGNKRVW